MSKLEELKAALAAATPGRWQVYWGTDYDEDGEEFITGCAAPVDLDARVDCGDYWTTTEADARLAALAVNLAPKLIAVAEAAGVMYPHARTRALNDALAALDGETT